jgi:hypothetical protein
VSIRCPWLGPSGRGSVAVSLTENQSRAVLQLGILRNSGHAALPRQLIVISTEFKWCLSLRVDLAIIGGAGLQSASSS